MSAPSENEKPAHWLDPQVWAVMRPILKSFARPSAGQQAGNAQVKVPYTRDQRLRALDQAGALLSEVQGIGTQMRALGEHEVIFGTAPVVKTFEDLIRTRLEEVMQMVLLVTMQHTFLRDAVIRESDDALQYQQEQRLMAQVGQLLAQVLSLPAVKRVFWRAPTLG